VVVEVSAPISPAWVSIYAPERAANGYTLAFFRRRMPIVLDMNGRLVHAWPEARTKSRVRLLKDGSLLGIALGRGVVEYDWDGNLTWEYRIEGDFPHHDVIRLENGNTMLIILVRARRTDSLLEVDRSGVIVWEWHADEHLARWFPDRNGKKKRADITHINSVQELPANRWFDGGDTRFRPGNLLISARNLDHIFVLDRSTGDAVWSYATDLDRQHESLMIEPGVPGAGNVMLFNNRFTSFDSDRYSEILEIDPTTDQVVWRYRDSSFFSGTSGVEQPLTNGNVLVTSSRGGRVFEIERDGTIVWEWTPPYRPTRTTRYAYDHCPQLEAMTRPIETAVQPTTEHRFVDQPLYRFARRDDRRKVTVDGEKVTMLTQNDICGHVLLPTAATARVAFGLDRARLRASGQRGVAVQFRLSVRLESSTTVDTLIDETLRLGDGGPTWQHRTLDLTERALARVEMCVHAERLDGAGRTEDFAYWTQPLIAAGPRDDATADAAVDGLTPEEIEARAEHLRALGYVD